MPPIATAGVGCHHYRPRMQIRLPRRATQKIMAVSVDTVEVDTLTGKTTTQPSGIRADPDYFAVGEWIKEKKKSI